MTVTTLHPVRAVSAVSSSAYACGRRKAAFGPPHERNVQVFFGVHRHRAARECVTDKYELKLPVEVDDSAHLRHCASWREWSPSY